MRLFYRILALVRWLFRRDEIERALDTDLADYIERSAAEKMRAGMSEKEARRAARIELGGVEQTKDSVRARLAFAPIDHTLADLGYALRTMRRQKAFTAAAVLTLALGIGVNAGVFTVLNGVLFRDLQAPDAHELVSIQQTVEGGQFTSRTGVGTFSTLEYRAYRDRAQTLTGVLAYAGAPSTILGGEAPQRIGGALVSCNYFAVLRQPPAVGRALTAQDCETGAAPVVVLGHELWTGTFAAHAEIVGRTVELNRQTFTIVGVAAVGTYGGHGGESFNVGYFAPLSAEPLLRPNNSRYESDEHLWLRLIGRRSEASTEQVLAELDVIAAQIDLEQPGRSTTLTVDRANQEIVPLGFRGVAIAVASVLMAAFGFILLIACANVANLLLVRGTTRNHEIAVRFSLGASRSRVIRQLLTESLVISLVGGLLGAVLGVWSLRALVALALPMFGLPSELVLGVGPDFRVLSFAIVLTLGTTLLVGLAPALAVSRPNLQAVIKQDTAGAGNSRRGGRLRGALVGLQVALCMALMIGAGLLLRGLYTTYTVDPGFDYGDVAVVTIDYQEGYQADIVRLRQRLIDEVEALPGVDGVAAATLAPLGTDEFFQVRVRLPGEGQDSFRLARLNGVTPRFFSLLGIPIVDGRDFTEDEIGRGEIDARPAIVSETTARNLWGGSDPIGQILLQDDTTLRVVGVAADVQATAMGGVDPYYVYAPASGWQVLLVKSRADLGTIAASIRTLARALDPTLSSLVRVSPLSDNLAWWRGLSATVTTLGASLGALALVLASVGIYGVVSYSVTRRWREIGIRMALGATAGNVLGMVLRGTMRPVIVGALIGIGAAVAMSGILSSVLFGVSPADPVGLGGGVMLVVGVALAAGLLAARNATRADPTAALRYE